MLSLIARLCVAFAAFVGAQDKPQEEGVLPRQPGDDVVKKLDKPLPDKTKNRIEAQSWFMAAKVEQREGRPAKAYEALEKALELDPSGVAIYREMIPLAFGLGKTEEAARLAARAIELDPDDYEILQQLSMLSAGSGRMGDAIKYTERALESERLDKLSVGAVILNRNLLRLAYQAGQLDKATSACDVLFDALKDPQKYKLEARAQRELAQQTELIGGVYAASGKSDKAIAVFEEQARVRGGRPGSHNYSLARLYFVKRDPENAEKQLLEYFKTKPREMEAFQMYSQILVGTDRKDELLGNIEKLADADKRNAGLQYFLADLYVEAKRLDDAEAVIKKTMRSSGNPAGYLGLAEIYRQQKNPKKLLKALVNAQRGGIDTSPLIGRIASDVETAEALLTDGKQMLEDDPESMDYRTNYLLGRIASIANKTKESITFLRTALQLGTAQQVPLVSLDLGTQLLFDDQYEEATSVFENALKNPDNSQQGRQRTVFLLYRLAQAHEFADNTEPALKALKKAQAMPEGDIPLLHYQEGWTYFHAQQTDKAEEKLQMVLANYTGDPDTTMRTRVLLASVHSQQRDFPTAIDEFESIIRDYARDKATVRSAQMSLSSLYISKGDQDKAESILEDVLKEDPEDPGVNNDLGYLYADRGKKLEQAEAMIRKAVKSAPDNAAYLDSLGWVLFRREKYREAIEWLEKAIKLPGGEDATIVEHLGDNFEQLGEKDEALKNWKRALKIETGAPYPDETVVNRLTKKVETGKSEPTDK